MALLIALLYTMLHDLLLHLEVTYNFKLMLLHSRVQLLTGIDNPKGLAWEAPTGYFIFRTRVSVL